MIDEIKIHPEWREALVAAFASPKMADLRKFLLTEERLAHAVYPARRDTFRALDLTPPAAVKVVILGQDPYHNTGQAHGLSFSVRHGTRIPPSLRNIYKEMETDLGIKMPSHGFLEAWATRGVLLLNTILTVRHGEPASHREQGWEEFTDAVVQHVAASSQPTVFMLWGAHAQKKAACVDESRHLVIRSPHPSPLSAYAGFFGTRPFSQANAFLEDRGRGAVDWTLPDIA